MTFDENDCAFILEYTVHEVMHLATHVMIIHEVVMHLATHKMIIRGSYAISYTCDDNMK